MNRLHVLVLLAAMACTGLVMGTVKAEAADSGKELRAAVNATAPPFAFMETGNWWDSRWICTLKSPSAWANSL